MNVDIREHIKDNFKNATTDEIKESIVTSIEEKDEVTLPGLGVFFEILWDKSNTEFQENILIAIKEAL